MYCDFWICKDIWSLSGVIISVIAMILYFIRPRICVCAYITNYGKKFQVTVRNQNLFRTITEVGCEICVTKDNFQITKTLSLIKDKTVSIKTRCDYYSFISQKKTLKEYKNFRVIILVPNVIGIKKLYEFKGELPADCFKVEKVRLNFNNKIHS